MKKITSDKLQMIGAMAIFGTIGIVRRYIPFPSSVIAFARGFIGTAFLLLLHFCRKEKFSVPALKRNWIILTISGALIGVNWICLFEAYRYTTVSVATVCYYMAPVFVILASPLVLHEALTWKKGLCALAAVGGMVLVSGVAETGFTGLTGVLFGLGAALMYAAVILLNKFLSDICASDRTVFQLGIASAAVLPYVLLTEAIAIPEVTAAVLGLLILTGVVHTGLAYTLYFSSMKSLSAQTVALFSYIDPVVAVLLSVLVLHERMSVPAGIGVALVIGAMAISELPPLKKRVRE